MAATIVSSTGGPLHCSWAAPQPLRHGVAAAHRPGPEAGSTCRPAVPLPAQGPLARRPAGRPVGPETYAARNRTSSPVPVDRKADPGAGGNWYASGTPSTARDSAAEKVRSAIRYDRCESMPRSRPSSSRCEASSRWMPERAAQPPDRDQQVDQLGPLGEQLGELVHDDQQRRQRGQVTPEGSPARSVVLGHPR